MPERHGNGGALVAGALLLVFLLAVFGVVRLLSRLTQRRSRSGAGSRLPERMAGPVSFKVSAVFWSLFLAGVGGTVYFGRAARPSLPAPVLPNSWTGLDRLAIGTVLVIAALSVLALRVRRRDPIALALRRAEAGDVDGAIRELRSLNFAQGESATRSHALALLFTRKGNWIDARKCLLEAEGLSGDRLRYRVEMAFVLKNLGRSEDALACLEPLVDSPRASLDAVCLSCDLLVDLGRWDEAVGRIAAAEAMFKGEVAASPSLARRHRPLIDACRERLETMRASKKKAGLEDL